MTNQLINQDSTLPSTSAFVSGAILDSAEDFDRFGSTLIAGNFNGDLRDDLIIGVPSEDIVSDGDNITNAGGVHAIFGSRNGLTGADTLAGFRNQFLSQGNSRISDAAEINDRLGSSFAVGDYDGDGEDDLAIGAPDEEINSVIFAGAVNVLYGSRSGLSLFGSQFWHQDAGGANRSGVISRAESREQFGTALAAGDFDGDGRDDLAIGVPNEDFSTFEDSGMVNILFGTDDGLSSADDRILLRGNPDIEGNSQVRSRFGSALASGDFDGDGLDDIAVGTPQDDVVDFNGSNTLVNAGSVSVFYGSNDKNFGDRDQLWHQNTIGVNDSNESEDRFGSTLGVGDFNGDGRDDLAIGVPNEDIGSQANAGAVNVLYGSNSGFTANGDQLWHQDITGISDTSQEGDMFGSSIAVGDFNGDGRDDLAVGVSREDVDSISNAGAVNVIYGSDNGLNAAGNQFLHQELPEIQETLEANDNFGSSITAGDFNGDGFDDLGIGVPLEDFNNITDGGITHVIYGSADGLVI